MTDTATLIQAISLMREAQEELVRGGHTMIAAHLATALGLADATLDRDAAHAEPRRA